VCVMSPFAPQAFTWTNVGFVGLCLFMQVVAAWLPNRRLQKPTGDRQGDADATALHTMSPTIFPVSTEPWNKTKFT